MRNFTNTIIIIAALLTLSACKKDNFEPEPVISDVPCLLKKETWIGDDENFTKTYEYDKYRRLVKMEWPKHYKWNQTIQYSSQGNIAKEIHYIDNKEKWQRTYFWKNDILTTISYYSKEGGWLEQYKTVYEFNEHGQALKKQGYSIENGLWKKSFYKLYSWENGNIIKTEHYNTHNTKTRTEIYEYDDKSNAYVSLGFTDFGIYFILSKNNITKITNTDINGTITSIYSYNYEYNDKGFPLKIALTKELPDTIITSEVTLEYECN